MYESVSYITKMSFVATSERNLLVIHNTMAAKIKSFKRLFIKKGLMMRTYEYINWLHTTSDYTGISEMITQLYSDLPPNWTMRYGKYMDLINYCMFLGLYRYKLDENDGKRLGLDCIAGLNTSHELGSAIEAKIRTIMNLD